MTAFSLSTDRTPIDQLHTVSADPGSVDPSLVDGVNKALALGAEAARDLASDGSAVIAVAGDSAQDDSGRTVFTTRTITVTVYAPPPVNHEVDASVDVPLSATSLPESISSQPIS